MKIDRSPVAEALRSRGLDREAEAVATSLRTLVDTERERSTVMDLRVDVDHLLDHLGRGGLGKMIGG